MQVKLRNRISYIYFEHCFSVYFRYLTCAVLKLTAQIMLCVKVIYLSGIADQIFQAYNMGYQYRYLEFKGIKNDFSLFAA